MVDINLTQQEADALLTMKKVRLDDKTAYDFPDLGGKIIIPLRSEDKREEFLLDVYRGRIDLLQTTCQNRSRQVVCLARLDLNGRIHRNPDGEMISCPHIHLYREDFQDKWAYPVDEKDFSNLDDHYITLQEFMKYCNVILPPIVRAGLFT